MKIIFGSDEKTSLTNFIGGWLRDKNYEVIECGHLVKEIEKWKWVDIGSEVGSSVSEGKVEMGIVSCSSGTGVCIAANRFRRARAALCWDAEIARLARKWNDANILCLSLCFTCEALTKEILEMWFSTKFDEEGLNQIHKLTNHGK